jgi:L-ascorbate metabolism protein UlaG (beta-lactamase superfamily)
LLPLPKGLALTWLGHAMFLVRTPQGRRVVIDPFVEGNPRFPADGRRHLESVDLILVTHGHNDHMGDAVPLARQTGAPVVCIHELSVWISGQGVQAIGMNKGGTVTAAGVTVTMVRAEHSSGFMDSQGRMVFGGEAAAFVVHLGDGEALYHAGDTGLFGDMALIGEMYRPTVGLLPIGGHYTMGPREAARAARMLGLRTVVPMHYGTFPPLTGTPEELRRELGDGVEVRVLTPGETVEG